MKGRNPNAEKNPVMGAAYARTSSQQADSSLELGALYPIDLRLARISCAVPVWDAHMRPAFCAEFGFAPYVVLTEKMDSGTHRKEAENFTNLGLKKGWGMEIWFRLHC